MNKKICALFSFVIILFCFSTVYAETSSQEKNMAYNSQTAYAVTGDYIYFDEAKGAITGCDDSVIIADIPSEINGVKVTSIGNDAFEFCQNLTSVTIPDSVTSIEDYAFSECGLSTIFVPESVTYIGNGVFSFCNSLESVTMPNCIEDTYAEAFSSDKKMETLILTGGSRGIKANDFINMDNFKSITLNNNCPYIEESAFSGCTGLSSITIPESVKTVGNSAFSGCTGINSITLPSTVETIGEGVFSGCTSLTSVTMPNNISGTYADFFTDCTSLNEIILNGGKEEIAQKAFYEMSGLTNIVINDNCKAIGDYAFGYCKGITSVDLPEGLLTIGERSFQQCTGLKTIVFPKSVTKASRFAFEYCTSLESATILSDMYMGVYLFDCCTNLKVMNFGADVKEMDLEKVRLCQFIQEFNVDPDNSTYATVDGILYNKAVTELLYYPMNKVGTSFNIPQSVTTIATKAFYSSSELSTVNIGENVSSIVYDSFTNCSGMTAVNVDQNNSNYASVEGVLFNKAKTELIKYPENKQAAAYTIPKGVKVLGSCAFDGAKHLNSVIISEGVTDINENCFYFCNNIKTVTLPSTLINIGEDAFNYVDFENVVIPDGVKTIGGGAFYSCSSLKTLTIPKSVTSIGVYPVYYCTNLETIYCYKGSVADNAELYKVNYDNTHKVNIVYLEEESTSEGTTTDSISYRIVGNKLYIDGKGKMDNYDNSTPPWEPFKASITHIIFGFEVESIGNSAFKDFVSLTRVDMATGITQIGDNAFKGCEWLRVVKIPDTVTSIGQSAFKGVWQYAAIYNYSDVEITQSNYVGSDINVINCDFIYGDVDLDGVITASDGATALSKSLDNTFIPEIQRYAKEYTNYIDVNGDGSILADDGANILQKALNPGFIFSAEP